eukprot:3034195-Rhodomonas_salina.3
MRGRGGDLGGGGRRGEGGGPRRSRSPLPARPLPTLRHPSAPHTSRPATAPRSPAGSRLRGAGRPRRTARRAPCLTAGTAQAARSQEALVPPYA